jgi:hypothetical protein
VLAQNKKIAMTKQKKKKNQKKKKKKKSFFVFQSNPVASSCISFITKNKQV